jgi:hypothetical protein
MLALVVAAACSDVTVPSYHQPNDSSEVDDSTDIDDKIG